MTDRSQALRPLGQLSEPTVDLFGAAYLPNGTNGYSRTLQRGDGGEGYRAGSPPTAREGVSDHVPTVGTVGDAVSGKQNDRSQTVGSTVGTVGLPPCRPDQLPDDTRYRWHERAGIGEYVGGLTRDEAERLAWDEILGVTR